jgi:hypothetical protein
VLTRLVAGLALIVVVLGPGCSDDGEEPSAGDGAEGSASTSAPSVSKTTADAESAPVGGDEAISGVPGDVADPVPIDAATDFGDGVGIRLSSIDTVEAKGSLPGEISGPAVAVTVEITNGRSDPIELDHVTVDLATKVGASAPPVVDPQREPLAGELAPEATRSGAYVFSLAADERADVTVRVNYSADTPTVLFTGNAPSA